MSELTARNAEICRLYQSGMRAKAIGQQFDITMGRVCQILHDAGIYKQRGNLARSGRTIFLGVEVTDTVKTALREEAKRRGISMSSLTSDALQEMLIACGHEVGQ